MAVEPSPQIELLFPLAGLPVPQRGRGQPLPNNFKFISVHNHGGSHYPAAVILRAAPPPHSEFIMCLDDFKPHHNVGLLFQTLRALHQRFPKFWPQAAEFWVARNYCKDSVNPYGHQTLSCWSLLTLILLTWKIWWVPNNASKWQMGFTSAFKGLSSSKIWGMNDGFVSTILYYGC
jgi:hypothetical protein